MVFLFYLLTIIRIALMNLLETDISSFILENCQEGIFMFDKEFRYTFFNKAMEKSTGYRRGECLGKKAAEIFPFLINTGKIELYKRILNGECFRLEDQVYFIPEKGKYGHYNAQYQPVYTKDGSISGGLVTIQETGKLKAAVSALKESEDRYFNLLENALFATIIFTEEEVLYVNQITVDILAAKGKEQVLGRSPVNFVKAAGRKRALHDIKNILAGKTTDPVRHELLRFDSTLFNAEITCGMIQYQGRKAIQAVIRDATREEKTFEELLNLQQLLSEAQKMARMGSYQLYLKDNTIFWSDELYEIFEVKKEKTEPTLDLYLSFIEETEAREELERLINEICSKEVSEVTTTHGLILPNGQQKWVKIIGRPSYNKEGEIESIVGSMQDITEQRKTEGALYQANQILNLHFENSLLGIIQLDNQLKVSKWSKQAERLLGWEAPEVSGKHLIDLDILHKSDQEVIKSIDDQLGGSNFTYKKDLIKLNTKSKTIVYCELFVSGISAEDGRLNSVFILLNDVTARQLAEKAREEGQEEERKRIARDIHDGIGQMLIAIKYKVASLEELLPEKETGELYKLESMLEQTIEEARSISKNLAPRSVATLGLESSLRQMCEQIKKLTAIDMKFRYIGGELEVNNKIVNALYRVAQEATQNIIKHAQATETNLQVFQGRNFIELKIEDNGKGIREEGSTGNGLKNMEERVALLGGRFQIYSEIDKGTSLIVNLPLVSYESEI